MTNLMIRSGSHQLPAHQRQWSVFGVCVLPRDTLRSVGALAGDVPNGRSRFGGEKWT